MSVIYGFLYDLMAYFENVEAYNFESFFGYCLDNWNKVCSLFSETQERVLRRFGISNKELCGVINLELRQRKHTHTHTLKQKLFSFNLAMHVLNLLCDVVYDDMSRYP